MSRSFIYSRNSDFVRGLSCSDLELVCLISTCCFLLNGFAFCVDCIYLMDLKTKWSENCFQTKQTNKVKQVQV